MRAAIRALCGSMELVSCAGVRLGPCGLASMLRVMQQRVARPVVTRPDVVVPLGGPLSTQDEFERWEELVLQRSLDRMDDLTYCPRCR